LRSYTNINNSHGVTQLQVNTYLSLLPTLRKKTQPDKESDSVDHRGILAVGVKDGTYL